MKGRIRIRKLPLLVFRLNYKTYQYSLDLQTQQLDMVQHPICIKMAGHAGNNKINCSTTCGFLGQQLGRRHTRTRGWEGEVKTSQFISSIEL